MCPSVNLSSYLKHVYLYVFMSFDNMFVSQPIFLHFVTFCISAKNNFHKAIGLDDDFDKF